MEIHAHSPDPIQWPGLIDGLGANHWIGGIAESAPFNPLLGSESFAFKKLASHSNGHQLEPLFSGDASFPQITRIGCAIHEINSFMWISPHILLFHIFN